MLSIAFVNLLYTHTEICLESFEAFPNCLFFLSAMKIRDITVSYFSYRGVKCRFFLIFGDINPKKFWFDLNRSKFSFAYILIEIFV